MPETPRLLLFFVAALILLLTPGPAVLYIVARSIDQGRVAGLVSVLSIEAGNFVHVLAATFGLSALLMSSALAFSAVKYLGAAYLIYLGIRKLLSHPVPIQVPGAAAQSLRRIFTQGVLVAVLNPKTALFFLAFLPQFVDSSRGPVARQMLLLGCIFVLMALISDSLYALLADSLGQWVRRSPAFLRGERYVVGGVYVGLGITAALAGPPRH
ncbi:MAG TPA: LysE family translocator [Anaerolineales bacterium]|jgi:threonine/homoserine/homoserine lactone efflux protein